MDIEKINYFEKNFTAKNPDTTLPSNFGKRWTEQEEFLLLTELDNNIDIDIIAEKHNRTKGGIVSRQKEIAYKMYIKNISMIEIINKTKLDEITINELIERKSYNKKSIKKNKIDEINEMKNDINEMKNDIKELKNTLKELVDMMKLKNTHPPKESKLNIRKFFFNPL